MKKTYIVILQIESKENFEKIVAYLKSFNAWARITDSSFALTTDLKATDIRNEIVKRKDENDRVFVIKSGIEAAWSNTRGRNQWFKDNL